MLNITQAEYRERRQKFLSQLPSNAIAILPASTEKHRSADGSYPYCPNANLYYLTGFDEMDAVAVFAKGRKEGEYILFNLPKEREKEIWTGYRVGQEEAIKKFGVDQAFSIHDFEKIWPTLLTGRSTLYYALGRHPTYDTKIIDTLNTLCTKARSAAKVPQEIVNVETILHEMRLFKSPAEIEIMRHAAQASVEAHKRAMKAAKRGLPERALEAELMYAFLIGGCREAAYTSIVAGGANGIVLHYTTNHDVLRDGEMVLVDAGGAYQYYASDITTTFPVNGRFSAEQKAIYDVVLKAQRAMIALVKPGLEWIAIQNKAYEIMTQGLVDLGILKGDVSKLIQDKALAKFYMHNSGHWLGLDTHDVGDYKIHDQWRKLEAGMVLTIEPGLYLSKEVSGLDKKWWDIAVRIEDDIVVTETGCDVLSKGLPRTTEEIEAFMLS